MKREQNVCFFLDSCILLPQSREEWAKSIKAFLEKKVAPHYVSSSVKAECLRTITRIFVWMIEDIKEKMQDFLDKSGVDKITRNDALLFEPYFEERRDYLRSKGSQAYLFKIQNVIERWLIRYVKEIPYGKDVKLDLFVAYLGSELTRIYEEILSQVEMVEEKSISPTAELRSYLAQHGIWKFPDQDHIASCIQYQYDKDIWVIFVTSDERSILSYRKFLQRNCCLHCTKPDYAVDRCESLRKKENLSPIGYFKQLKDYTSAQADFAKSLLSATSTDLLQKVHQETSEED